MATSAENDAESDGDGDDDRVTDDYDGDKDYEEVGPFYHQRKTLNRYNRGFWLIIKNKN